MAGRGDRIGCFKKPKRISLRRAENARAAGEGIVCLGKTDLRRAGQVSAMAT